MPKEHPFEAIESFKLVLEPELVFLVEEFEEIQQLCRSLNHRNGRRLSVINKSRNSAVGIETEEPFGLLDIGRDVDYGGGPFGSVFSSQLFEHDLSSLAIGSVLSDQMNTLGILDVVRGLGDVQLVCHGCV